VWEPFNGRAPIFLPEFNSDPDDHGELTARADGSNAAAIPYVTPANDDVPTSLRLRAHCRALLCHLVAGGSPRSLSCDPIRDAVAFTPSETIS
jgi:hypothetical protein